jgi:branched-subunit amino acid transport protein
MSATVYLWLVVIVAGAATFLTRLSFIALFARREMPRWLQRPLKHVPPAMLTALIAPAILLSARGELSLPPDNLRLVAALVAGGAAFQTRSTTWTIVAGMVTLWLLQGLQAAF